MIPFTHYPTCDVHEVCDHQQQWWYSTALEHWEQSLWTNLHGSLSEILGTCKGALELSCLTQPFFFPKWWFSNEISLFQGNLGWWNIIIWPDSLLTNNLQWFWIDASILCWSRSISHAADCFKRMWDIGTVNLSRHNLSRWVHGNWLRKLYTYVQWIILVLVIGGRGYIKPPRRQYIPGI